jgi:hypothetical protein
MTGNRQGGLDHAHTLLGPEEIIARPVDPGIKALDDLDAALREILGPAAQ